VNLSSIFPVETLRKLHILGNFQPRYSKIHLDQFVFDPLFQDLQLDQIGEFTLKTKQDPKASQQGEKDQNEFSHVHSPILELFYRKVGIISDERF